VPEHRRQSKRVALNVRFKGGGMSANLAGRIVDLSGTGLFIVTRQFIPIGKEVHLEFVLPGGKVEAVGEVRWIARGEDVPEAGLGIRFLRLSAAHARIIDEAVGEG
jgi:uncharacterized protein (TIGR02266 family)